MSRPSIVPIALTLDDRTGYTLWAPPWEEDGEEWQAFLGSTVDLPADINDDDPEAPGPTAVVVTSKDRPLPAVTLAEVLATSDVPGGVVNLLTGDAEELGTWLAEHADVDAIDLAGAPAPLAMELERSAAGTVKRVLRAPAEEPDWSADPGLSRLTPFLETKTVWHPIGL